MTAKPCHSYSSLLLFGGRVSLPLPFAWPGEPGTAAASRVRRRSLASGGTSPIASAALYCATASSRSPCKSKMRPKIDVTPGDDMGIFGRIQRFLKVGLRALHVTVEAGDFGQHKVGSRRVFIGLQALLRQLLGLGRIAAGQRLLRQVDPLLRCVFRRLHHLGYACGGESDLAGALLFLLHIDVVQPVGKGVLQADACLFEIAAADRRSSRSERSPRLRRAAPGPRDLFPAAWDRMGLRASMARIRHSITSSPMSRLYSSAIGAVCTESRIGLQTIQRGGPLGNQRVEHEVQIGVPQRIHVDVVAGWRDHQVVEILQIVAGVHLAGRCHRLEVHREAAARSSPTSACAGNCRWS